MPIKRPLPNYQGPGKYRHYKGGEYLVLGLSVHDVIIDADRRKMCVTCGDMVPLNLTEAESA